MTRTETITMPSRTILAAVLCAAFTLAACGDKPAPDAPPPSAGTADLPAALFAAAAPADARNVSDVRETAAEGDTVVIRGRVGGPTPFVPGRAIMTLADAEKLIACSDRENDPCPDPWDYCCESPDDIAANSVTVQVVGNDGRPLKADLEGAGGIAPLDFVVVTGRVGPRPDPAVLVIDATSIHVEK